jgi:hypothetical protein
MSFEVKYFDLKTHTFPAPPRVLIQPNGRVVTPPRQLASGAESR